MKEKLKSILLIVICSIICLSVFCMKNAVAENRTGNTVVINLAPEGYKIGSFWTYRKAGSRNLDVFCAQHGAHINSYNNYTYNEVVWDKDAGIWAASARATDAYEKITWIKNNFWEKTNASEGNKFTTAQKLQILKTVDSSITEADIKNVFDNNNEKFKLYQEITWTYTNGYNGANPGALAGSTRKVYDAIVKLAEKNYKNNGKETISITENSKIKQNADGSYTWDLKINNTCVLPYEEELEVDGNKYTNYTNNNGKLEIKGLSAGKHHFSFSVATYQVSSTASVWINSSAQNFLEITSTKKSKKTDAITSEAGSDGYYKLNIKKENADKNNEAVPGAKFNVDNKEYTTGSNGIAEIINDSNKVQITKNNQEFTHTISEVSTTNTLVHLSGNVEIKLKSGTKSVNGKSIFYIREAVFKENGNNELEAITDNGESVTLKISSKLEGETSVVTVTIPNKERIYDLALTKSLVIPFSDIAERYDLNLDGSVDASDASMALSVFSPMLANPNPPLDTLKDYLKNSKAELWNRYYKYLDDDELTHKFDLNQDGKVNSSDWYECPNILSIYANLAVGNGNDRLNSVNARNIGKDGSTTATYNMNKTIYEVKAKDIITYKITIYNEGDLDSKDIQITDYLPDELIPCNELGDTTVKDNKIISTFGGQTYEWIIDGKKATTTINKKLGKRKDDRALERASVYINCKIDETKVEAGDILYNVAEISKSTPLDDEGNALSNIKDRDSDENSLSTEENLIDKYKKKFEDVTGDDSAEYVDKSTYNYQDDDDFERIVIKPASIFDLALRKSITKVGTAENQMQIVNVKSTDDEGKVTTRLPKITEATVKECQKKGTGAYFHAKEYVEIDKKDFVEYTIRVYNEGTDGDYSGYAKQITDYLPQDLEFYAIVNQDGKWITKETNGKYVTEENKFGKYEATYDKANNKVIIDCINIPALETKRNLNKIKGLNSKYEMGYYNSKEEFNELRYAYQELKIICKVSDSFKGEKLLTNIAEITNSIAINDDKKEDSTIKEKDSTPKNVSIEDKTDIRNKKANLDTYYADRDVDDTYNVYYPGMEDDDDFETVKVKYIPKDGKYNVVLIKTDSKGNPLTDKETTFSIGGESKTTIDGNLNIATDVAITKDKQEDIYEIEETVAPDGYELYTGKIKLTVLSKENEDGFEIDESSMKLTVNGIELEQNKISEDGYVTWNKQGNTITIKVKNEYADLALRKFITKVDDKEIANREPDVDIANLVDRTSTTATYTHPKDPVLVANGQLVTYTLRVYNEGTMDAYASLIKDDIPEGLEFVTYTQGDGSTNDIYKWKLIDENEIEVTDVSKAKYIITDYLAKDEEGKNLIKAFDPDTMNELDYRDVKVQFKVIEPNKSDRVIVNYAQISEETDSNGNKVTDRDSTPNEWKGEDDEDIEKVRVLYFDLALRKWVTQAIVIENGQTYVTETGHKAEDDPEEVVKVDLKKSKLNNVTVKFRYSIRITNEGEIAGEATEIRDDIPNGLKFVAEDNPDWREEDGKIVTNKLAGTTLQPGESAEVEIILTWVNSEDNMGVMVNTAEISKDHNEYGTPDIDSTPGNYVPGEDDIDDAPVMLTITTGSEMIMFVSLSLGVLAIIGVGIIVIKKQVLV